MTAMEDKIDNIKEAVFKEKKIANEFKSLFNYFENSKDEQEKKMVNSQIEKLKSLLINANDELPVLIEKIRKGMSGKISGTDVAFNMVSGSGKEHMAVLSALLKLGVGIRLVSYVNDSLKEI